MSNWLLLFTIPAAVVAVPLLVYLCVRMGTYGYLRGRQAFREDSKKAKGNGECNGKCKRKGGGV